MLGKKTQNGKITEKDILAALSKVQEPELHNDLVSLNMVKDIHINGGQVGFTIVLTTPACPLRGQMERESQAAVISGRLHRRCPRVVVGRYSTPA